MGNFIYYFFGFTLFLTLTTQMLSMIYFWVESDELDKSVVKWLTTLNFISWIITIFLTS